MQKENKKSLNIKTIEYALRKGRKNFSRFYGQRPVNGCFPAYRDNVGNVDKLP